MSISPPSGHLEAVTVQNAGQTLQMESGTCCTSRTTTESRYVLYEEIRLLSRPLAEGGTMLWKSGRIMNLSPEAMRKIEQVSHLCRDWKCKILCTVCHVLPHGSCLVYVIDTTMSWIIENLPLKSFHEA